jgi:hypothetical protein
MKEPAKKEGGHESPPAGYPESRDKYADPQNYKYPIDTREHVRAAWSYINQEKNQKGYTPEEIASMKKRILAAAKRFGIFKTSKAEKKAE